MWWCDCVSRYSPRTELTISPWVCRGRCFRECPRWGGSRVWRISQWVTGRGSQRGTPASAWTWDPRTQSLWGPPPCPPRTAGCPRQGRRRCPCPRTSWDSWVHSVTFWRPAGWRRRRIYGWGWTKMISHLSKKIPYLLRASLSTPSWSLLVVGFTFWAMIFKNDNCSGSNLKICILKMYYIYYRITEYLDTNQRESFWNNNNEQRLLQGRGSLPTTTHSPQRDDKK